MRDLIKFRLINKIEKKIIVDSLLKLSLVILPYFEKNDYRLYISLNRLEVETKFPSIYLISRDQGNLLEKILKVEIVCSAGVHFGFIKKGIFNLSLEGVEFLHNQDKIPKSKQIIVNKEGEKSILYGNNILKKMVIMMPLELKKNAFLVVFNQNQDIIAIAKSLIDYKSYQNFDSNKITALNLIDKGYYLRKKQ